MRHILKFLPKDRRDEANQKYAKEAPLPNPVERRKTARVNTRNARKLTRPEDAPPERTGDATGEWRFGGMKPESERSVSAKTGEYFKFLSDGDLTLQDTGAFRKPRADNFNPYNKN